MIDHQGNAEMRDFSLPNVACGSFTSEAVEATQAGAGCVKCLFRATRRQVIPRGWMSNAHNYLPDCFDHQLWLILVDIMAAVFGHEEACVRNERRQIFVRRT